MKTKLKLVFLSLMTLCIMSLPSVVHAQDDSLSSGDGDSWVCCQANSTGCTDRMGYFYPEDYKSFTPSCDCVCPPSVG